MDEDVQNKINQLSMLDQNVQNFAVQKQQFQAQMLEMESAEKELDGSKESFIIIGNIMVSKSKKDILKNVSDKKDLLKKRIDTIEKQEIKLKEKAEALQKEVIANMKKEKK